MTFFQVIMSGLALGLQNADDPRQFTRLAVTRGLARSAAWLVWVQSGLACKVGDLPCPW